MFNRLAWSALVVAMVTMPGCSGDGGDGSPTSPSVGGGGGNQLYVVFTPANVGSVTGTYTAQLNNQTYTAAGGFPVSLAAGTYEISGSFTGGGFGIGFTRVLGGGAESGSLRSITGPQPDTSQPCSLLYFNMNTPTVRRDFRMQFRVTDSTTTSCR